MDQFEKDNLIREMLSEISDIQCTICEYDDVLSSIEISLKSLTERLEKTRKMRTELDDTMQKFLLLLSDVTRV